tara:strand:+ start:58 stop:690 length:633 start_codon:yes stop_codon:yes gene_type:complete
MSQITFSISDLIEQAWSKFKEQPFLWVSITIITIIIGSLGGGLDMDPETLETAFNLIGFIASLLSLYLSASVTLMGIRYMRGESISFNDLLAIDFGTFIHYFLATIVSAMCVIVGFLFFILPGLYIMSRLIFVQYLVVDKKLSFNQAIKESWKVSDGNGLNLIGFLLAIFFVIIVGFLAFLIGILVAIPITSLASAQLYLLFTNQKNVTF